MTGRGLAANSAPRRCKHAIAWFAVLALLINALVPASLAAAAGRSAETVSGWCGAAPGHRQPAQGGAAAFCNHCILCGPTAVGLEPPVATGASTPTLITVAVRQGVALDALPQVPRNKSAQPRGPPTAVRT